MRDWCALQGAARDVIFRQTPEPGRMALLDFTDATESDVTIAAAPFPHRLFHSALAYSGWEHAAVVLGGEGELLIQAGFFVLAQPPSARSTRGSIAEMSDAA